MFTIIRTTKLATLKDKARDAGIFEKMADRLRRERDEARAELSQLHTKRIAPLMAANKRRSEEAAAKRAEKNA